MRPASLPALTSNWKRRHATRIQVLAHQILQVSKERLRDELIKIVTEGYASRGIQLLETLRLLRPILPEISDLQGVEQPPEFHPEGDVWVHTLLMLQLMDETKREMPKDQTPRRPIGPLWQLRAILWAPGFIHRSRSP